MSKGQHDRLQRIEVQGNTLKIAGRLASELVDIAGGTPCYVYDRQAMSLRVEQLRNALPKELKLHYAIKANPLPAVVSHMAALVDGLDVASHKEMILALGSGVAPGQVSFAGPSKGINELRAAVAAGIVVNVESQLELERLYQLGKEQQVKPRVAFRVNPGFELKSSGMKMAGGAKPFGIDSEQMPKILDDSRLAQLDFQGFHIFPGSQNLKAEALIEAHNKTFELASWLAGLAPAPVKHVNIGGGLGIPYFPGEVALDLAPVAENLKRLLLAFPVALGKTGFIMELGRFLVGEAGYYLCRVTDKKVSRGQAYLATDGGLHQHLANSGNFGQVLRKNYPVLLANRVRGEKREKVEIVGPLCTPLDILGAKLDLPEAEVGDLVVVFQSGAYGATASPQDFLGHPHVRELMI